MKGFPPSLAFLLVAAAACGASSRPSAPSASLNERVTLAVGATTMIDTNLTVHFDGVPADSRCPGDAICIWQGDAVLRVSAGLKGRPSTTFELGVNDPLRREAAIRDYLIRVESLDPYPFLSRPTDPRSYRVTLRVVRGSSG